LKVEKKDWPHPEEDLFLGPSGFIVDKTKQRTIRKPALDRRADGKERLEYRGRKGGGRRQVLTKKQEKGGTTKEANVK